MSGQGRAVLVTAGGAGIGRVIARTFAAQGDRVHVCDVDAEAVAEAAAEGLAASRVDVGDGDALDAWIDGAVADLGGVDILVNNAGTSGPTAFVEDVDPAAWEACLRIGLTSHFRAAARVAPHMKAAGRGSIICLSSTAGIHGFGRRTPYASVKWGVIGLVKSLAIELGPHGVRVNAVCPGPVDGPRIQRVFAAEAAARGVDPATVQAQLVSGQSIRRLIQPEEIAEVCSFLASSGAAMINGQAIVVDGNTETYHISG